MSETEKVAESVELTRAAKLALLKRSVGIGWPMRLAGGFSASFIAVFSAAADTSLHSTMIVMIGVVGFVGLVFCYQTAINRLQRQVDALTSLLLEQREL